MSLGDLNYLSLLQYSDVVIGNSSSGIIEVPYFKKPTVNIGNRQRNRLRSSSIIDCQANAKEIIDAISKSLSNEFKEVLSKVDALVAPVSPTPTPKLGYIQNDPLKAYMMDVLTVPVNMAGLPALTVPSGFIDNLPIGVQFIGKHFDESLLYKIGYAFEQETKYYKKLPEFKVFP